jgi:hypothetical protein
MNVAASKGYEWRMNESNIGARKKMCGGMREGRRNIGASKEDAGRKVEGRRKIDANEEDVQRNECRKEE